MPSNKWLNLLVLSLHDNGTFHLNSISTKFSSTFPQKMEKKKILPPICDPMKRYPVEIIFNS